MNAKAIRRGEVFTNAMPTLVLLDRYRVSRERSLSRNIAELERLQRRREEMWAENSMGKKHISPETGDKIIDLTAKSID